MRLLASFRLIVVDFSEFTKTTKIYCHLKRDDDVRTVEAIFTLSWVKAWEQRRVNFTRLIAPFLVSCQVPIEMEAPDFVSFSNESCKMQGKRYRVENRESTTKNFVTVCVKPMEFPTDISVKFLGWMEMNLILGASKFDIFVHEVHKNLSNILDWYARKKIADIRSPQYLDEHPKNNLYMKRKYEVIFYLDCFYRNRYYSEYILPIDIDEVIIPRKVYTWKELISGFEKYISYSFINVYYVTSNSSKIPYFTSTYRGSYSSVGRSEKSFLTSDYTLTLYNHNFIGSLKPTKSVGRNLHISTNDAQMNHYKSHCNRTLLVECVRIFKKEFYDPLIVKYKDDFDRNVKFRSKELKLFYDLELSDFY